MVLLMSATPQLHSVLATLRALKGKLRQEWGVTEIAVFGSVARGEATEASDIDLMIDYEDAAGWHVLTVGDYLEEVLGRKVDILFKRAVRPEVWPCLNDELIDA